MTSHPSLPHKAGDSVMVRYSDHPFPDRWMRAEIIALDGDVTSPVFTFRYRVRYPDDPEALHTSYVVGDVRPVHADDLAREMSKP